MSYFSEENIRKVRDANDLVELFSERAVVRQRGRDFWCCCPFHQEKTPSCKIDPSTQTWHCFGCGEGGDAITFVRKIDDLDFIDAVRFLARRGNVEIHETNETRKYHSKKARLKALCKEAASFYHMQLMRSPSQDAQRARQYLSSRELGGEVPNNWNLGFAPGRGQLVSHLSSCGYTAQEMVEANVAIQRDGHLRDRFFNRVMFPINDIRGDCIAFGGRVIGSGEPKYLNTSESPLFHKSEVLYGLDKAKSTMTSSGVALVVEGYTDVITLHQAGFTNAVATLGTALTKQHIRSLSHHAKSKIIYLFDGDEAGQRAADRALSFIDESITPEAGGQKVDLFAVTLPDNLDPCDFIHQRGKEELDKLLNSAIPLIRYGIDRRLAVHDLSTPEGRSRATMDALKLLAPIKASLLAKDYAVYIASRVKAREEDVLMKLDSLKSPSSRSLSSAPIKKQAKRILSPTEKNRLRSEKEFLSLCAQNPAMALDFFNVLGQTDWHEKIHRDLAEMLMDILAETPNITVPDLLLKAQEKNHYANRVFTSSVIQGNYSSYEALQYLSDELSIGDLENTISSMRDQLKRSDEAGPEERDQMFHAIVVLQNELNAIRSRHTITE